MTNIQGDKICLFVGSGIGFQKASMIFIESTVYKIKTNVHKLNDLSFGCLILYEQKSIIFYLIYCHLIQDIIKVVIL